MATLKDLEKYLDYEFSSGGDTGEDYKIFQNKYINYLRAICKQNGWELVNVGRNHYEFSAFFRDSESHYIYFSISDVRFWQNEWHNHILVRTAKSEKDYTGGRNCYTELPILHCAIKNMFNKEF
ncbi:MAG: hypothetical protein RSC44_02580 [Clostridia bacterium]